jgi:hypothetical protein
MAAPKHSTEQRRTRQTSDRNAAEADVNALVSARLAFPGEGRNKDER